MSNSTVTYVFGRHSMGFGKQSFYVHVCMFTLMGITLLPYFKSGAYILCKNWREPRSQIGQTFASILKEGQLIINLGQQARKLK